MTRKFNFWLSAFLLAAGAAFWWLLLEDGSRDAAPYPLHMASLRQLAAQMPGPAPKAVEVELTATSLLPGDYVVAGGGLRKRALATAVFRLAPSSGKAVVIADGPGIDAAPARGYAPAPAAMRRGRAAWAGAGLIVLTDSGFPHANAAQAPGREPASAFAHACLSPAQRADLAEMLANARPPAVLPAPCLSGQKPEAVAPGVVVIPAAGHAPGSQMAYVRLANGQEYLFTGDTAPLDASWRQLRARARLVGDWRDHEDRRAVFAWLLTIRQLAREAPRMIVVPGSDRIWLTQAAAAHALSAGFCRA